MQKQFAAAYSKGDLDAMAKRGLHDYSVKRVSSRTDGGFIFDVGEWRAKVGDPPLHGYYTAILVQGDGLPRIMEETVAVASP